MVAKISACRDFQLKSLDQREILVDLIYKPQNLKITTATRNLTMELRIVIPTLYQKAEETWALYWHRLAIMSQIWNLHVPIDITSHLRIS